MNDLIERIEAAREDNADLFRAAATAVFGTVPNAMNRFLAAGAFTDAAMMFVPKEGLCEINWYRGNGVGEDEATVWPAYGEELCFHCEAATPALALSAAALKARAYLKETNNAD